MGVTPVDQSTAAGPQVVATEGGTVTLVDLAGLQARLNALQATASAERDQASSLHGLAEGRWRELGSALLGPTAKWSPEPAIEVSLKRAAALQVEIQENDSSLNAVRDHQGSGLGSLLGRVGSWKTGHDLSSARSKLDAELNPLLATIGRTAKGEIPPEAALLRDQAAAAEVEAGANDSAASAASAEAATVRDEVDRRTQSEHDLGFDALYLAAYLQTHGPDPVQSPLILKKGERACLSIAATLSRQQTRRQWVGGSQGFSFPIGHTGIRYRVGSFRGHPVEQQFLGKIDSGRLTVTNQRIAFIGAVKSTSTPLPKLLHVECYSDAVAVFQDGRENPDYYLTAQSKYVLFMINWALSQAGS